MKKMICEQQIVLVLVFSSLYLYLYLGKCICEKKTSGPLLTACQLAGKKHDMWSQTASKFKMHNCVQHKIDFYKTTVEEKQ